MRWGRGLGPDPEGPPRPPSRRRWPSVVLGLSLLWLAGGCASTSGPFPDAVPPAAEESTRAPASGEPDGAEEAPRPTPLARFNMASGDFNYWMQKHVVKNAARGYNWVVPKLLQEGIGNVLENAQRPRDIVNSLLQAKFERAGRHLAHLILNTAFGFGGIFYVSPRVLYDDSPETFNETLGVWGVPPGPYLQLPLVVPPFSQTSPRALAGAAFDLLTNPLTWFGWFDGGAVFTVTNATITGVGGLNTVAQFMPVPWASQAEWDAFHEFFDARLPYEDAKRLYFENQQLDVED